MLDNVNICILLAYYNGSAYIREQINSIIIQKKIKKFHIFISVDKPSEYDELLISSLISEYKCITRLPKTSQATGPGANFFHLIENIAPEEFTHFAFSDQDDIWDDRKLHTAINVMANYEVDAYSSNVMAFWGVDKKIPIKKNINQRKFDYLLEAAGPGCTYVLSADIFIALQNFIKANKSVYEIRLHDWFIYAFAKNFRYKWFIDERSDLLFYRQHEANAVGVNIGFNAFIKRIILLFSGEWFDQSCKIYKLLCKNNLLNINNNIDFYKFIILNSRELRRGLIDSYAIKCFATIFYIKELLK
jgi:rhamnosyltransferase